ncbi:MAG: choice-of-anchor A family protein, partial [Ruminococcus sp.]|nr:choice-of-anchor A family protein [Ruminococcus sp.]
MNKLKTRSISFITAFMMSMMSIMTGLSPTTVSAEPVTIPSASGKSETDDVTLLVGKDSKLRGSDITSTIKNYEKSYALGIASQFCLFLRDNFTPNNSDAEGRVAVGGNIISETGNNEYEAGNGDFTGHVSLDELIKNSGYANVIVNGTANGLIPTSWNEYTLADGTKGYPEKKFWVKDKDSFTPSKNFTDNAGDRWSGNINDYLYEGSTAFNIADYFDKTLGGISDKLLNQKSDTSVTFKSNATPISYFNQWDPAQYKGDFKDFTPTGETVFTYNGSPSAKTVYFDLTEAEWKKASNTQVFRFEGIPDDAYIVVNVAGKAIDINPDGEDRYTYIHDKAISKGSFTVVKADGSIVPVADVNAVLKGNFDYDNENFQKELDKIIKDNFGEGAYVTGMFNNYQEVDRILYNFHEAEKISYQQAFQGTIFAPNADVDSKQGHLSGALIAKSAKGGMEFGYRPFQGPKSMLGATSGYVIPVKKTDGINLLAGATLELVDGEEVVSEIDTTGEAPFDLITIPTTIDFEGNTTYELDKPITKTYILREKSAPAGYSKTDETKTITLEATIKSLVEGTKIPEEVEIKISVGDKVIESFSFADTYKGDSDELTLESRTIKTADGNYVLTLDGGTVTSVKKEGSTSDIPDVNPAESGFFENGLYYYDAESMIITQLPQTADVPEFVNEAQEIKLVKVSASDNTITLPGAELEIYKAEDIDKTDRVAVAKGTTDENGVLELGHLEPGEYCIVETKAPVVGEDKYITPKTPIKFTVTKDYKVEGESTDGASYDITYKVSGDATEYKTTISDSITRTLRNGIPSTSTPVESFTETKPIKDIDESNNNFKVDYNYNTSNSTNYNADCTGKKITKVVVETGDGLWDGKGALYFKDANDKDMFDYGEGKYWFDISANDTFTFDTVNENAVFGKNGFIEVAGWNVNIKSIQYFVEGLETSAVNTTVDVGNITIKFDDKSLEGTKLSLDIGNDKILTGTVDENGICTFEINGKLGKFPRLEATDIQTGSINIIPSTDEGENEDSTIEFKLPNRKQRSENPHIEINKINMRGVEVVGAELLLTIESGTDTINGTANELKWISDSNDTFVIENIQDGTYKLTETKAPNGYLIAEPITFTVAGGKIVNVNNEDVKDGALEKDKVFVLSTEKETLENGTEKEHSLLEMRDGRLLRLKKTDSTGKPLERAIFELSATDITSGEQIEFNTKIVKFDEKYWSYNDDNTIITWNSRGIPGENETEADIPDVSEIEIRNLPNGNYTLKEVTAPSGYKAKTVKFTINKGVVTCEDDKGLEDGEKLIHIDSSLENGGGGNDIYEVVVKDEDSLLRFSKKDIYGTDTELKNAEFKLTRITKNADGTETEAEFDITQDNLSAGMTLSDDKKSITWTSGTRMSITNIKNGTYKLQETKAPDGYETAKDITITVANGVITGATVDGKSVMNTNVNSSKNTVTVYDKFLVKISKQELVKDENDEETSKALSEATLLLIGVNNATDKTPIEFTENNIAGTNAELTQATADEDGKITEDANGTYSAIKWVSQETALELQGLPNGIYTLTEIATPDDTYEIAAPISFTVTDGKITMKGTAVPNNTIVMIDNKKTEDKEISINKVDADGNDLAGATLILTGEDADGNAIVLNKDNIATGDSTESTTTTVSNAETSSATSTTTTEPAISTVEETTTSTTESTENSGIDTQDDESEVTENPTIITLDGKDITAIQWVSDGKELKLKNLPEGTYTLHEEVVPNGYEQAEDIIFTVDKDGKVSIVTENADGTETTTPAENNTIKMIDNKEEDKEISINKVDADGNDLADATLVLTGNADDENKTPIEFKEDNIKDTTAKLVKDADDKDTAIQWVSDGKALTLKNLPDGNYTLKETEVPDDKYEIATPINFTVKDGKITTTGEGITETSVKMVNKEKETSTTTTTTAFTVRIDKVDETGTRVTGAELSLKGTDKDGNQIVFNEDNVPDVSYLVTGTSASTTTTTVSGSSEGESTTEPTSTETTTTATTTSTTTTSADVAPQADDDEVTTSTSDTPSDETKETVTATKLAWISGDKEAVFNLPAGTYVLHEDKAPEGYETAKDITFTVDDKGIITVITEVEDEEGNVVTDADSKVVTATATTDKIQMTDIKTTTETTESSSTTTTTTTTTTTATVNIVKIGSESSTTYYLAGALLELTGNDGTSTIVFGDEYKDYFTVITTTTASTTGTGTSDETTSTSTSAGVVAQADDDVSTSTLSSVSTTAGTTEADDTVTTATATKLMWYSGDKPFPIGLPAGEYTLVEAIVPDGYKKAEPIVFTVDEDGKVTRKDGKSVKDDNTIEMIDEKITTSTTTTTTTTSTTTTSTTTTYTTTSTTTTSTTTTSTTTSTTTTTTTTTTTSTTTTTTTTSTTTTSTTTTSTTTSTTTTSTTTT